MKKTIIEYGLIILLVVFIRIFIITPIQVSGSSMNNTLQDNDIMLLNIIGYKLKNIKRFDIVVIDYEEEALIKRVIGLPGENIEYKDNKLYVDGNYIKELFINDEYTDDFSLNDLGYQVIPDNMYFILGDNRDNSTDSRYIGLINKDQIIGKTNIIIYPFSRWGLVK
ncbi:MAG: signal peptidase I [Bacilli bacterium]|jgi:signal peptidase I|nr:signal peptidase I [Bacilli bacterium]